MSLLSSLDQLLFHNRFVDAFPADNITENYPRQVLNAAYSFVKPTPVSQPHCIAYATDVARCLDLSAACSESAAFTEVFSGNRLLPGMQPYASCYGGHQFGYWAGQLGDGRAINLGEVVNQQGQYLTLQLKGAGLTPYSRRADGLAVLRSSIREFLCSEAMHHLGVPTTRALSVMLTGETVVRDMFYNGNPKAELGAVVCRVAPSFTRFGHFQLFSARQDYHLLEQLVEFTIATDFKAYQLLPKEQRYLAWFSDVCQRTAHMIVHWQRVGFVHGVMNTDNMSILGLTIDYGPYGWLDNFDSDWTPNTTDADERRYRFGNQPAIAFWNLAQLANAITPLFKIKTQPKLVAALASYNEIFAHEWQKMMALKLGFSAFDVSTDHELCSELFEVLQQAEIDMSLFFRQLANVSLDKDGSDNDHLTLFNDVFYQPEQLTTEVQQKFLGWLKKYHCRLLKEHDVTHRKQRMDAVNPKYVLRNYLAQQAIDKAEQGDFSMVKELLALVERPYEEQPDKAHYALKRPDWAKQRAGCSMLSCSS
jgi:uncharacterized protein YdiU (UPF0061 family)